MHALKKTGVMMRRVLTVMMTVIAEVTAASNLTQQPSETGAAVERPW